MVSRDVQALGCDHPAANIAELTGADCMSLEQVTQPVYGEILSGNWVSYYSTSKSEGESNGPKVNFENLTDELTRRSSAPGRSLARYRMGSSLRASEPSRRRDRWLNSKVAIRPSTRPATQHLLSAIYPLLLRRRLSACMQVTDIERFRTELGAGIPASINRVYRTRSVSEAWSARSRAKQLCKAAEDRHSLDQQALTVLSMVFNYAMSQSVGGAKPSRGCIARPL